MPASISDQGIPQCPDPLQRTLRRWCWGAVAALALTVPAFYFLNPLFNKIVTLGTASFWLAGAALGLVLSAGPVACLVCLLVALFVRVRLGFGSGNRPLGGMDWAFTLCALLITFAPALAALYVPIKAVATGYIAFRGEGQQYPRTADPYGFWQAVGFWLMGSATLAYLAYRYWRARFTRPRQADPAA